MNSSCEYSLLPDLIYYIIDIFQTSILNFSPAAASLVNKKKLIYFGILLSLNQRLLNRLCKKEIL